MSPIPVILVALFGVALGIKLPGRIVGGQTTTIEEYPYQLSLRRISSHICGASIINPNYALTAAHCVAKMTAFELILHSGTSFRNQPGHLHFIRSIHVHPQFDGIDYDFAVLEVSTPFPIGTKGVAAIPLTSAEPQPNDKAIVSGWGRLSTDGKPADQLQVVSLPIIDRQVCENKWADYGYTKNMICAGFEDGSKDSCIGDSGGPLVVNGKQCGIVSWGLACADPAHPGVYSNIAEQLDWIKDIAGL